MAATSKARRGTSMKLDAATAVDLMRENPISIAEDATVQEAISLLTAHCFSAAPVIDTAGRAIGVLSRTDLPGWAIFASWPTCWSAPRSWLKTN
jgi:CBS domain-containing protein